MSKTSKSSTIPEFFNLSWDEDLSGPPLQSLASEDNDLERHIVSQYHAAGAVSGAFMLRAGRWKYIEYVGHELELFDIANDPEETQNLATTNLKMVTQLARALRQYVEPKDADAEAFSAQEALIKKLGGRDSALQLGARGATPVPLK